MRLFALLAAILLAAVPLRSGEGAADSGVWLEVSYLDGSAPIPNARIQVIAVCEEREITQSFGDFQTDASGKARFRVNLDQFTRRNARLATFYVSAFDAGRGPRASTFYLLLPATKTSYSVALNTVDGPH